MTLLNEALVVGSAFFVQHAKLSVFYAYAFPRHKVWGYVHHHHEVVFTRYVGAGYANFCGFEFHVFGFKTKE
jgi:hypothetical protein